VGFSIRPYEIKTLKLWIEAGNRINSSDHWPILCDVAFV